MIYTSYFANLRNLPENVIPIAICAKVPDWYTGLRYKRLAPSYDILMKWKADHDDDAYIKSYIETILDKLNVNRILIDLQILLPYEVRYKMQSTVWNNPDWHIALICYEKPSDFCHRHIVADWINGGTGYRCEEWKGEN